MHACNRAAQLVQVFQFVFELPLAGQEFVDRRIQQAHRDRARRHHLEQVLEIAALYRQQVVQCGYAVLGIVGEDHLHHHGQPLGGVEHAFGTAQADTHRAVVAGLLRRLRRVGIGHDLQHRYLIRPFQQGIQFRGELRFDRRDLSQVDVAGAAVDGDDVTLVQYLVTDLRLAIANIDRDAFRAGHAGLAHAAGDDRGMRGLAAAAGEDALGGEKAVNVFGLGFLAHQDDLLAGTAQQFRTVGVKGHGTGGTAWRGGQALCHRVDTVGRVEHGVQQLFQFLGIDAQQRLVTGYQAFCDHFHRGAHPRRGVHLAVAGLQAVERAFLDGVFKVLYFAVMRFQAVAQVDQLPVHLRHFLFHLLHRLRGANAGNHVLALGIDQVLAVHDVFAGARVAREADAGGAVGAHVAEHHGHHIDRGTVRHVSW